MEHAEALGLLGLHSEATADEVRTAFRRRIRLAHPDLADRCGAPRTSEARLLIVAYRAALEHVVIAPPIGGGAHESAVDHAGPVRSAAQPKPGGVAWLADCDTIALRCPHEEAFSRMLEVGTGLGAITYLDRQGELFEVLLTTKLGDTVSLVISFQGRSDWVEAFLTTEVLDVARHEIPTIDQITELVLHELLRRW